MSSPQHCLAMADEADRLAAIVSYERDKAKLRDQAQAWRKMAGVLGEPVVASAPCEIVVHAETPRPVPMRRAASVAGWLGRRWA